MITQITDLDLFKQKALAWAAGFEVCCFLDSNNFDDPYTKFDTLIAIGTKDSLTASSGHAFGHLERFRKKHPGWIMGFFGYDLKNETENLTSANNDCLHFPDLYFFVPLYLVIIRDDQAEILADDPQAILACITAQELKPGIGLPVVKIQSRLSKAAYLSAVEKIREHINRGDIYVTNFCQEFFAEDTMIDPLKVFFELNQRSPNPFASFFKWHDNYILCATPERFLAKRGDKLISQPIKGTAKRGRNAAEDGQLISDLRNHFKELQENVMIVDLVRNDLTRSARKGTVKTEELYGIYSFKQVHQMISTIVCELGDEVTPVQAIKNAFPMGSMTGAPKISAMQLMEYYEPARRGVYSGSIGYFDPNNDFDFNVVIRTLLYNQAEKYLSFQAGSAITYHADAEKEYEECLLKAQAIFEVLGQLQSFLQSSQ